MKDTVIKQLANDFCALELPKSVCADMCATNKEYQYPRHGTNLLTVDEAYQMFHELFKDKYLITKIY